MSQQAASQQALPFSAAPPPLSLHVAPQYPLASGGPLWWAVFTTPSGREVARTLVSGGTRAQARRQARTHLRTLQSHLPQNHR